MGGKKPPKIKAPDTQAIIRDQIRLNRVDTSSPFGSQRYVTGPDGRTSFQTELSPELQSLVTRGMNLSGRDMQRWSMPDQANQILAQVMARVNRRTGGSP